MPHHWSIPLIASSIVLMCFLCEREASQRLGLIGEASIATGLALSTDPVPTQDLISNAAAQFSQQLVVADGVMDLYLHAPGGAIEISGGGFGSQTIQSVAIQGQDQSYIRSIVKRLDTIIDLDFAFVGEASKADTAFYYDQEIDTGGGGSGQTLGLAVTGSVGWELFINYPEVANDWDYRQYVNVHEWGHSLGLEHPFEAGDGDTYERNTNPWTSAFPEQTVMAYRSPESGDWPDFFTTSDLNALIEIWGAEAQFFSMEADEVWGQDYRESIYSARGDDLINAAAGNDLVRAGKGNDFVNGNQGNDEIWGDLGDDTLRGGKGNDFMNGNQGNDALWGDLGDDTLRGGKDNDWLFGGIGNDALWGDRGADRFRVSKGNDTIWDFSFAAGDRLELKEELGYQLTQSGADLLFSTALGSAMLINNNLSDFPVDAVFLV